MPQASSIYEKPVNRIFDLPPPLLQNGCYVFQSVHRPVPNSFSLRICSPEMQAKSAERAFGYRPSDSHPCPAGTKSNRCYGRSSDSSRSPRLPGKNQWQRVRMNRFSRKRGTYSSEHCSGFAPDSLLLRTLRKNIRIPFAGANIRIIFNSKTQKNTTTS